jgi:DNA-directed RNA polymerase subunit M/transcription elongation factor TFIIS
MSGCQRVFCPDCGQSTEVTEIDITVDCDTCGSTYDVEENTESPEDEDYDDDLDYFDDELDFADPGGNSALRRATPDNPRDQPCPTCGGQNLLTPADVELGYQCDGCADRAERGGW